MEIIWSTNRQTPARGHTRNVGTVERLASLTAGALLLVRGLPKKGWLGTGAALLGIAFLRRALTGFSYSYDALGIDSADVGEDNKLATS